MKIKQTDRALYIPIHKEGCLFMSLLDIACDAVSDSLLPLEVNAIYDYAVPKYMDEDCYVKDHAEIIKLGFYILGERFTSAYYGYRRDKGTIVIGNDTTFGQCNYWISQVDTGRFLHFYRSDKYGSILYNPGVSTGELVSLRGYCVRILREGE